MRPGGYVALFVVTDAGIDNDAVFTGIYDQRMDAHNQIALLVHKVWLHPAYGLTGIAGCVRQDKTAAPSGFHLNDPSNLDRTNLPSVHALPPSLQSR